MIHMTKSTIKRSPGTTPGQATVRTRAVPAVTRAIAILRLLGKVKEPMGVNAIAQALDLIPSTCLHILRTLVEEKLISVDGDTKRYRLGMGVLTLARSARSRIPHFVCGPSSTNSKLCMRLSSLLSMLVW